MDPPSETTEYVHRVGRTARLGKSGSAVLFLSPHESEYVKILASHGLHLKQMKSDHLLASLREVAPPSSNDASALLCRPQVLLLGACKTVLACVSAALRVFRESSVIKRTVDVQRAIELAAVAWQNTCEELTANDAKVRRGCTLALSVWG